MEFFDWAEQHFAWATLGEMLYQLTMIGVMSWLIVEVLKRIDTDRPNWKNFRLVHKERPFFKKEMGGEVALALINRVFVIPCTLLVSAVLVDYTVGTHFPERAFAPTIESWPFWVQVVVGLVVLDFSLYVRHRFVHHYFWSYHTIHHSTREITWITWLKLHPLDQVAMGVIDAVIMFLLGFGGDAIAFAAVVKFHFNRFCHSNIALDYGFPLRYIFVSPNMHRWHHAADDPQAINKNFCIVFAWIDLLFGTYYVPKDRLPNHYGVWDASGKDVVGTGVLEMLAYPFVQNWRGLRRPAPPIEAEEPKPELVMPPPPAE